MKYALLSARDMAAIDALAASYGGAPEISQTTRDRRGYETRKHILADTAFGGMIADAEFIFDGKILTVLGKKPQCLCPV